MKTTENRYEKGATLAYRIGSNIQNARENADGESRGTLTQAELAKHAKELDKNLKLSERTIGKIERGERMIRIPELLAICSVLKISPSEVLTGEQPKYFRVTEIVGLSEKSIQNLEKLHKKRYAGISALNIILEDEKMALALIDALVLYAEAQELKVSPLLPNTEDNFIYLNSRTSDDIMKQVALQKLSRLLEYLRQRWDLRNYPILEEDIKRFLLSAKKNNKTPSATLIDRLRYKMRKSQREAQGYPVVDISKTDNECETSLDKIAQCLREEKQQIRMQEKLNILQQILETGE